MPSAQRDQTGPALAQPAGPRCTDVLLIEDDDGDAVLVEELLNADVHMRWNLIRVRTLAAAEDLLGATRHKPACLLVDLHLPDGSGTDALARVLPLAPRSAVVVLTGMIDQDLGLAAVAAGAQDYLVKGQVDEALLSRSLRFALERRRVEEVAFRRDHNVRLERGLLPKPHLVPDSDIRWAMRYRPGGDGILGGDFFDLFQQPDGTVRAIIGDVCGHGPDEAAIGVSLRVAWRALALAGAGPEDVLPLLDEILRGERHHDDLFVTLCDVTFEPGRGSLSLRSCGHPPPLLMGPNDVQLLDVEQGMPIGVFDDASWAATTVALPEHWSLVLYTDGLIEGRDGDDRWGVHGLLEHAPRLLAGVGVGVDLEAFVRELADEAVMRNGGPLHDDLAILAIGCGP
jgi:FixJ family two-component response regulator